MMNYSKADLRRFYIQFTDIYFIIIYTNVKKPVCRNKNQND
jgi:hypothetical protein